jgi:hypothetical protein
MALFFLDQGASSITQDAGYYNQPGGIPARMMKPGATQPSYIR